MTSQQLHKLFDIQIDKVSQYTSPAFTPEEKDAFLNQASAAIAASKYTGHNVLKQGFEQDYKRIVDLQNLCKQKLIVFSPLVAEGKNTLVFDSVVDEKMLSIYDVSLTVTTVTVEDGVEDPTTVFNNVIIVSNEVAKRFKQTETNIPWIDVPVCTVYNNKVAVYLDPVKYESLLAVVNTNTTSTSDTWNLSISYVHTPTVIAYDDYNDITDYPENVWYEVVSQASLIALDNIESERTQIHQAVTQGE